MNNLKDFSKFSRESQNIVGSSPLHKVLLGQLNPAWVDAGPEKNIKFLVNEEGAFKAINSEPNPALVYPKELSAK